MELRKIDTLEELRREKFRLQHEAEVARGLFQKQIVVTIEESKKAVLGSWKTSVPVVAFAAIKRFVQNKAAEAPLDPNPVISSVKDGLNVFQQPGGPEKWFSLVPILKNLLDEWIKGDQAEEMDARAEGNTSEPSVPADVNPARRPIVTY